MFTGIIETVGRIQSKQALGGDYRIGIDVGAMSLDDVSLGDSIAVNGTCLTVVELSTATFWADVSGETLAYTTLGDKMIGASVNLEKALQLTSRLGGHIVSGHCDGVGVISRLDRDARSWRFWIDAPAELAKYIAHKGSITVDGTSLTVNKVDGRRFELNIIPHTMDGTIIGEYKVGTRVNLEVDVLARYLERLMLGERAANVSESGLSASFLAEHGFGTPDY